MCASFVYESSSLTQTRTQKTMHLAQQPSNRQPMPFSELSLSSLSLISRLWSGAHTSLRKQCAIKLIFSWFIKEFRIVVCHIWAHSLLRYSLCVVDDVSYSYLFIVTVLSLLLARMYDGAGNATATRNDVGFTFSEIFYTSFVALLWWRARMNIARLKSNFMRRWKINGRRWRSIRRLLW